MPPAAFFADFRRHVICAYALRIATRVDAFLICQRVSLIFRRFRYYDAYAVMLYNACCYSYAMLLRRLRLF